MRSRGVALGSLVLLTLCQAGPAPAVTSELGERVVAIEYHCDAPLDREDLNRLVPIHVGDPLNPHELAEAERRLKLTGIFAGVAVESEPRDGGVAVVIRLVRQDIVNSIRFRGNETVRNEDLYRIIRIREGNALSAELRAYAIDRIRHRYLAEGFPDVGVSLHLQPRSPGEADVRFDIAEGEPLRISEIAFTGALPVEETDLRDVIPLREGDRYVRALHREAERRIVRHLRDAAHYEARVQSSWKLRDGKQGLLHFHIDAGPAFVISVSGNRRFRDRTLLGLMDLTTRAIVTDGTWRELARRIEERYHESGYYFARVRLMIQEAVPKIVELEVVEGNRFRVAEVKFEGELGLSEKMLLGAMATGPPSWVYWRSGFLIDAVFQEDLRRLWFLYREHGFRSAEIADARTRFDQEKGRVVVTVLVEAGRRTVVGEVSLSGFETVPSKKIPVLRTRAGEPYDERRVEQDRATLLTLLVQEGHADAVVDVTKSIEQGPARDIANVSFEAVPGELQAVGALIVQNNVDTRSRVILRELSFRSGDTLKPDALLEGQSRIYQLGLFRSVTVRPLTSDAEDRPADMPRKEPVGIPRPDETAGEAAKRAEVETSEEERRADVVVSVAEKPAGAMQWGAGYNTRDGLRGFVEVGHSNLQGMARRLSLRGEFNLEIGDVVPNEYLGNLTFREPRILSSAWALRSNLIAQRATRRVDQFSIERFAFVPAIERTLLPGLQVGVEAQLEHANVFDLEPDVLAFNPRDEGVLMTVSLGPFVVYDRRDDPFAPTRGTYDSVRARFAPALIGSDVPFSKLQAQHSHYLPIGGGLTFVYVARAGWAEPFREGDITPIRERFFLGGRTTVRGFEENEIGPQGDSGNPLGGDVVLNVNAEIRFPLLAGFAGAVFADGGGAYLRERSVSIEDFRRSAGIGLRYLTPVGPVSLDYGFKLDRRSDESIGEVHFSIGTNF
jgi:outer membrane protein insertion porin family